LQAPVRAPFFSALEVAVLDARGDEFLFRTAEMLRVE